MWHVVVRVPREEEKKKISEMNTDLISHQLDYNLDSDGIMSLPVLQPSLTAGQECILLRDYNVS